MATRTLNIMSICAGVGGIDLGIQLATRARTVCYVEREACAAATLVARMEESSLGEAPVWDNLTTFDGKPWRGIVDCIAAGLPCQPYSQAGAQRGNDDERAIWPEFIRVVSEVRPSMVFLENVPTFITKGHFRGAGEALCRMGYQIEDPLFLRASDVGAPHKRERVFILAHRDGRGCGERSERWCEQAEPQQPAPQRDNAGGCSVELAHAASQPKREPNDAERTVPREEPRENTGGGSGAVELSQGARLEGFDGEGDTPQRRPDDIRSAAGRATATGGAVGDAERKRLERGTGPEVRPGDTGGTAERERETVGDPKSRPVGREPLPDTISDALWQQPERGDGGAQTSICGNTGTGPMGVFPPGPNDYAAWDNILRERPDLAPAVESPVQRMADGPPGGVGELFTSRADQLRLVGNSVCVPAAAVAFAVLTGEDFS